MSKFNIVHVPNEEVRNSFPDLPDPSTLPKVMELSDSINVGNTFSDGTNFFKVIKCEEAGAMSQLPILTITDAFPRAF